MKTLDEATKDFLAQRRIAVVGVSRTGNQPANFIFRKLRDAGHEVFPVNAATAAVEGVTCYPALKWIPGGVTAAVIVTPAEATEGVVRECAELGIRRVWLHRSFGAGSVSAAAIQAARTAGLTLIPAGCPMMFCAPVDLPHRCFRWCLKLTGGLPATVEN
jgi:predicted CoA-binding protein